MVEEKDGDLNVSYPTRYSIDSHELGIDTARIFCGTKANWDLYREEAAVYTGADGLFGNLMVFRCHGESTPAGFLLVGAVDADLTTEQDLYRELCSSFTDYNGGIKVLGSRLFPSSIAAVGALKFNKRRHPHLDEARCRLLMIHVDALK